MRRGALSVLLDWQGIVVDSGQKGLLRGKTPSFRVQ